MDKRKLTVVKMETPAFPEADLSYAAYPDGSTAIGAAPTKDQEERVKRWNAYPELVAELERLNTSLQNIAFAPTKGPYKGTMDGTKEAVLEQVRSINTLLQTLNT